MTTEEMDLILKRQEMSKETWIRNVMRIHPDKTMEETEALWLKIFQSDSATLIPTKTNLVEQEELIEKALDYLDNLYLFEFKNELITISELQQRTRELITDLITRKPV